MLLISNDWSEVHACSLHMSSFHSSAHLEVHTHACGRQDSNPNSTPKCVILIHKKLYQVTQQQVKRPEQRMATFPKKAVSFSLNILKFSYSWFWEEEEKGRVGWFWFPWEKHGVRREITYFSKDLSCETWEGLILAELSFKLMRRAGLGGLLLQKRILLWSRDIVYLVEYLFSITQGYPWDPESNPLPFLKLDG